VSVLDWAGVHSWLFLLIFPYRISQLEMLDEIEELDLILDHYAVTWGLNLPTSLGGSRWSSWQIKRRTEPEDEDTD